MDKKTIGKLIKKSRINKKMSQQELATKLNVTRQAVSNWENEVSYPDQSLYASLCKELDLKLNDIYGNLIENDFDYLLKINNKKHHKIIFILSITFIFIISVLLYINLNNTFHYYKININSNYFKLNNSYYLYSNNKNYLTIGNISSEVFSLENATINIFYKENNQEISIYNGKYNTDLILRTNRHDIIKHLNNLYIEILYTYNKNEYEEEVKLNFKEIMNTYHLINNQDSTIIENKTIYTLYHNTLLSYGYNYISNSKIYIKESLYNYYYSPIDYTFTVSGGTNDNIFYAQKNYQDNIIKIGFLSSDKRKDYVTIYLNDSIIKYSNNKFEYEPYLSILNKELSKLESN